MAAIRASAEVLEESALEEPRLIEDEMAYLSRLFGSLIWIIRGYHIALQHLVAYM